MSCCGKCKSIKSNVNGYDFKNNIKRCNRFCECYIQTEASNCPCCGFPLRTKSRSNKTRIRMEQERALLAH